MQDVGYEARPQSAAENRRREAAALSVLFRNVKVLALDNGSHQCP